MSKVEIDGADYKITINSDMSLDICEYDGLYGRSLAKIPKHQSVELCNAVRKMTKVLGHDSEYVKLPKILEGGKIQEIFVSKNDISSFGAPLDREDITRVVMKSSNRNCRVHDIYMTMEELSELLC